MTVQAVDDPVERRLVGWLERTIGGSVTAITRQDRWRPAWFVELTRPFGVERLYVRGDRGAGGIEREYRLLKVLEANGVPVPHVRGLCPDPLAIVMTEAPGRADLSTAESEAERRSVMDHYVELLAALHAIDPAEFEAVGFVRPSGPEAIAGIYFEGAVARYRAAKRRPEPLLEFMIGWVKRNRPRSRNRVTLVWGDPAQFLFQDGRITALLDFEFAHLGDPMHDLAAMQLRDTSEPLGDIARVLRRYADLTGEMIDAEAFDFHLIQFAVATPVDLANSVSRPLPTSDLVQYMEWSVHLSRMPMELIARRAGVTLAPLPPPESRPTRWGVMAEGLIGAIRDIPAADGFAAYRREAVAKLAAYLQRIGEMGPAFDEQDLAATEALLGAKFDSWQAADAALEAFVQEAGPDLDSVLIPFFHRRSQRQQVLIEPFLSRLTVAKPLKTLAELMGDSAPTPGFQSGGRPARLDQATTIAS